MNTKPIHWIALILLIIGGVNWGLVGFFQFDLVATLFGGSDAIWSRIVYALVGLSALVVAGTSFAMTEPSRTPRQMGA